MMDSDEKIRSLSPEIRKCRFEDESDILSLYQHYSQSNCFLECMLNLAHNQLRLENPKVPVCTPWMFPFKDGHSTYCDPWQAKQFIEILTSLTRSHACKQCLPDCRKTVYTPMVTTVPFRDQYYKTFCGDIIYFLLFCTTS